MATAEQIRSLLRTYWHRVADTCEPAGGDFGVSAWLVTAAGEEFVAVYAAAAGRAQFDAGLRAAERLDRAGIPAGLPVPAVDGALSVATPNGVLALLRRVPGRRLSADDPLDQQWWGDALGRAHLALAAFSHPGLPRWHRVRPTAGHLSVEDWVRPAVTAAVAAVARLSVTDVLTYGVLHGDPAPGVFRLDLATGCTGMTGWTAPQAGPLVYDLAAAVAHADSPDAVPDLLDAYRSTGAVPADEIAAALPTMLRFRWAALADHFARRVAEGGGGSGRSGGEQPAWRHEDLAALHRARDEDLAALHRARDALAAFG